jgi:hypothetical protein
VLDPLAVSVDKMFDLVQVGETSLREERGRRALFASRFSSHRWFSRPNFAEYV